MAGRGTDIILGGNPEGLTQLCLLRLIFSRLLHSSSPDAASIPQLPLDVFDVYDQQEVAKIGVRSEEEARVGLSRNLHLALLGAILLMTTHVQADKDERYGLGGDQLVDDNRVGFGLDFAFRMVV